MQLTAIDKAELAFIIAAIIDVIITAYALWLGYPEGNPLFSWIPSNVIILVLLTLGIPLLVFVAEYALVKCNCESYITTTFYLMAGYRFMFGPFGWILYIFSNGTVYLPINSIEHLIAIAASII